MSERKNVKVRRGNRVWGGLEILFGADVDSGKASRYRADREGDGEEVNEYYKRTYGHEASSGLKVCVCVFATL